MRALQSLIILFLCAGFVFAQQHRVGTTGPEPPPLQGQGRWHYRAPLPPARSEVAVAEVAGKVYVIGGYADGFVDQPLEANQASSFSEAGLQSHQLRRDRRRKG